MPRCTHTRRQRSPLPPPTHTPPAPPTQTHLITTTQSIAYLGSGPLLGNLQRSLGHLHGPRCAHNGRAIATSDPCECAQSNAASGARRTRTYRGWQWPAQDWESSAVRPTHRCDRVLWLHLGLSRLPARQGPRRAARGDRSVDGSLRSAGGLLVRHVITSLPTLVPQHIISHHQTASQRFNSQGFAALDPGSPTNLAPLAMGLPPSASTSLELPRSTRRGIAENSHLLGVGAPQGGAAAAMPVVQAMEIHPSDNSKAKASASATGSAVRATRATSSPALWRRPLSRHLRLQATA